MMKGQKGITLVALVITIIVMLILVGVSLSIVLDGGLLEKADNAAQQYNAAAESDKEGGVTINNDTAANVINEYL